MDTHGHHRVLQEGAVPRVERAFHERGGDEPNANALYLGNWLADLSQVNDPGSTIVQQLRRDLTADAKRRASGISAQMSARIRAALTPAAGSGPQPVPRPDPSLAGQLVDMVQRRAKELLTGVLAAASSGPTLGEHLISLVRVLGYLKFAHPQSNPRGQEISYPAYSVIFGELCRQYYPHEHLDRPLCTASYGDTCVAAWGAAAGAGPRDRLYAVERRKAGPDPHLYSYLVDDRKILAGRLTELDLDWASRDLTPDSQMSPDERDTWLARLGHTLHGVEDFFAHSTFIEHAMSARGAEASATAIRSRPVRRVGEPLTANTAGNKVQRRLRRYSPELYEPDSGEGVPEDAVVTGYFDGWDTLNSLLHVVEELVRPTLHAYETRERRGPLEATIRALLETYKSETVDDVLDMLKLLAPAEEPSFDTKVHRALDGLFDYVERARAAKPRPDGENPAKDIDRARSVTARAANEYAAKDPILGLLPPQLRREYLVPAVLGLSRLVPVGQTTWTIYKGLKAISEFAANPVGYLLQPLTTDAHKTLLKAYARIVAELVVKDALVDLNYILLTELQRLFRADRIGCHSLLAKDQPTEPLYAEMFKCARHADWLLADTLCRWSNKDWIGSTQPDRTFVRWDELLGALLQAPVDIPQAAVRRITWGDVSGLRVREVTGADETLQTAYAALSTMFDDAVRVGSYEEFLTANLTATGGRSLFVHGPVGGTNLDEQAAVEIAVAAGLARLTPGGHRLVRGATFVLPVERWIRVDRVESSTWFADVIALGTLEAWQDATLSYESSRLTSAPTVFGHIALTYHVGPTHDGARNAAGRFRQEAADFRHKMENAYPHQSRR